MESPGYVLWQLTHAMQQRMTTALDELSLNLPQLGTLVHLARDEAVSTADLARLTLMTPQNMSLTVSKLKAAGYLVSHPHEVHGRINRLELTPAGVRTLRRAIARVTAVEDEMLRQVPAAGRKALTHLLRDCLANLKVAKAARSPS